MRAVRAVLLRREHAHLDVRRAGQLDRSAAVGRSSTVLGSVRLDVDAWPKAPSQPMVALDILRGFAENNAWSNLRLFRACEMLSPEEFTATRTSFFSSIRLTLEHILLVDLYYLDGLVRGGRGTKVREDVAALATFTAIRVAQAETDARLVAFVTRLADEAALDGIVDLQRSDHVQREKVGDVLMHLFQHQIHHRGQVHAMLAGTPVKPPQLDEFFMAEEAHLREHELRDLGLPVR